ncbi:MAG: hypothetical protein HUK26_02680 [Duodenibacillus sp.]|nr:hypothetical protein [Duodenibacillus sp.]
MTEPIDAEWLKATLSDALDTLAEALALVEDDPRRARGVLEHEIPQVYAKLNYAVNTAATGPADLDAADHNALVAWPQGEAYGAFGLHAAGPDFSGLAGSEGVEQADDIAWTLGEDGEIEEDDEAGEADFEPGDGVEEMMAAERQPVEPEQK